MKKSSYNHLILLTIVVTMIIIASFIYIENYFNTKIEEARISQYQKQQLQTAIQTSSSLKDFMEYMKGELLSMSISSPPGGYYSIEKKFLSNYYKSLVDSIASIVKTDRLGRVNSHSKDYLKLDYPKILQANFKNLDQANQDAVVTEVTSDAKTYVLIAVPIYETPRYTSSLQGEFDGMIVAAIDISLAEELYLSQIKTGLSNNILLLNNKGTLLSNPSRFMTLSKNDNYFEWVKTTYPQNSNNINQMIAESEGYFINMWEPEPATISSFSYTFFSAGYGWIVIFDTPVEEIKEEIIPLQQKMLYFLIATVVSFSVFFIIILLALRSKEKTELQLQNAELTLEKLGIVANPEMNALGTSSVTLKGNHIYLIKESTFGRGIDFYFNILSSDKVGLIFTRENPQNITDRFNIANTPIIKLRKPKSKEDKLSIIDCSDLLAIITEFIKKNSSPVVFIDRLDYIIANNGFEKTLRFIYDLKDNLSERSIILISLNPSAASSQQISLIEEETQDISNLITKDKIMLTKDQFDLLDYIKQQNSDNKKVVFKDISDRFRITKPTTKKRINELLELRFISIEETGREKSLLLSDEGKRYIEKR